MEQKCAFISEAAQMSEQPLGRQALWKDWYRDGILKQMHACETQLRDLGLSSSALWKQAVGNADDEEDLRARRKRAKDCFQKRLGKLWWLGFRLIMWHE